MAGKAIDDALERARANREEVEREGVRPAARAIVRPAVDEFIRPAKRARAVSLEERLERVRNEYRRGRLRRFRMKELI